MKNSNCNEDGREFVHVMLKPDALDAGLKDVILKTLLVSGASVVLEKKTVLTLEQVLAIYRDFEDINAQQAVLAFYMAKQTEHFVFYGDKGLHEKILDIKGSKTDETGIRGKYASRNTMTATELLAIVDGVLPGARDAVSYVNFDLFGTDMLHSADDQIDSFVAIRAIFTKEELSGLDI